MSELDPGKNDPLSTNPESELQSQDDQVENPSQTIAESIRVANEFVESNPDMGIGVNSGSVYDDYLAESLAHDPVMNSTGVTPDSIRDYLIAQGRNEQEAEAISESVAEKVKQIKRQEMLLRRDSRPKTSPDSLQLPPEKPKAS